MAKCTYEFMIDFFLQSHRPILYLKKQQKVHPAKRFEILRPRQHGLLTTNQQRYSAVKGARDAAASQNATNKHNLSKAAHVPRRPCGLWCPVFNMYLT